MKVRLNNLYRRLGIVAVCGATLVSGGCQQDPTTDVNPPQPQEEYNQISFGKFDYKVDMVATRAEEQSYNYEEDGAYYSLTATPRGLETRSSFDDIVWDDKDSKVGIYLVEHIDNDADLTNTSKVKVLAASANLSRNGNVITSSSVQLLEQVKHYVSGNTFAGKTVDACAYFPYAKEITQAVALSNTSNSIVGIFQSENANNVVHLPFTMKPTQTDGNIWYHDLMVSVRERPNDLNAFGNIGKKNRSTYNGSTITGYYDMDENFRTDRGTQITCDNIHMRMRHLFSRFNITIKYDERFEGSRIGRIYVDGSKVYSYGEINLLTGEVTPGGASKIDRLIPDKDLYIHGDVNTVMMLCPCELTGENQMVFHIFIEGVEYKCDLYKMMKDVEVKESYIYNLTFSFTKNSTLVVNNGYGGTSVAVQYNPGEYDTYGTYGERWDIASGETDYPLLEIGDMANWLVAAPKLGWSFKGFYVNGEAIPYNTGSDPLEHVTDGYRIREYTDAEGDLRYHYYCKIEEVDEKNTRYDVVYIPEGDAWYASPEHIIQQFDGVYNNGFQSVVVTDANGVDREVPAPTDPTTAVWKDLSGRGNDAQLKNIDIHSELQPWRNTLYDQTAKGSPASPATYLQYASTQQSGWVEDGLKFDGINDYVTFPAVLPNRDNDPETQDMNMTLELYVTLERAQPGRYPRILCEAEPGTMANDTDLTTFTTHGYPSFLFTSLNDAASSSNVIFYSPENNTAIYFMGCGHNNGHTPEGKLKFGPDGNRIMHIVFWYRGGYGELTDMSIFKDTHQYNKVSELGLGDPRNCFVAMLEYWNPSINRMVRQTMAFYGHNPSSGPFLGKDGVPEYKKLLEAIYNHGAEATDAQFEQMKADNIDYTRELTQALSHAIYLQEHNSYLEDPFMPSERWACIGGRPNDFSRQFNGTVFSYIVYDKLLTIEEVNHNLQLHFDRFGAYKTDVR